jgi:WD40 repeat protein
MRRRCCIARLGGLRDEPQAHQFDADRAAAAALDGSLLLWDMRLGGGGGGGGACVEAKPVLRLQHDFPVHAFQMDGDSRLVAGEWDGSISVWELRTGTRLARFEGGQGGAGHEERVWAVAVDQHRAITGGLDRKLQLLSFS